MIIRAVRLSLWCLTPLFLGRGEHMNVHCASCGADLDAHRNRALIFSLIPHIARKLTLFMAIFIDRCLKLLNVSIKQAIFIYCLLDTVTVAGIYDLRRLQIKRCGRLGPRTVLALDCCPSLLLFPMWPHFLHRLRNLTQYFMHALQLVRSYLSSWIIQVSKNKMCRSTESAVRFFSCFNEQLSHKSSKINKSNDRCAPFYSICCTSVRVATISLIS